MRRFLIIITFGISIIACKPGIPKDIIQPDKMEKVLFDIHLVDGYSALMTNPDSAKNVSAPLYKGIYKKYGVDSALYHKSLDYYYAHPDIFKKMYDNITDKLTKAKDKQSKLEAAALKAKAKTDSIKNAKKLDSIKKVSKKPTDTILKPLKFRPNIKNQK
jgi:hypothetical protein